MTKPRPRPSLAVAGRALAISEVVSFLAPLVVLPRVTRSLGLEGYGRVQTVLTLAAFAGLLANPGLGTVATRRTARRPETASRVLARLHPLRLLGGVVAGTLLAALPVLGSWPAGMAHLLRIAALMVVAQSLSTEPYLLGAGDGRWVGNLRAGAACVHALAVLLLVHGVGDDSTLLWVYVSTTAGAALLHAVRFRSRHGRLRLAPRMRSARVLLREATGFGLSSVMSLVYARVDILLLRALRGEAEVGRYAACVRITEATYAVLNVLQGTLYPRAVTEGRRSGRRASVIAQRALRIACALTVPAAIGASLAGGPIVVWVAGSGFDGSDALMAILGSVAVAGGFASIYTAFGLSAKGRSLAVLLATLAGALVNVGVNALLIPAWGATGAAWTTLMAQGVVAATAAWLSRHDLRVAPWRALRPWLLPAALMGATVAAARLASAHAAVLLLLGVASYAVAVGCLGVLRRGERRGVRRALGARVT